MAPRWPWARQRVSGDPTSANGASSFHLWWHLDTDQPLVEVAAVLEVLTLPTVDRLYFWALQVSFLDGAADRGAAHTGLQWNRNHPGNRAVNWGGYASGGGLLAGSASRLPSAPADPNTRDYRWERGRPYRLRVSRVPLVTGRWQADVTDLRSGRSTVIRELEAAADRLASPLVWSEVFARCEHPSVTVRWSGLEGTTATGEIVTPTRLKVSYQAETAGGCSNSNVTLDEEGVLQVTNTRRTVQHGAVIDLRGRA